MIIESSFEKLTADMERKLEAFYWLKDALKASHDFERFTKDISAIVTQALGALGCTFSLVREGEIWRVAEIGAEVNSLKFLTAERSLLSSVIKTKRKTIKKINKLEFYLSIPFLVKEEVVGALVVSSRFSFQERDESFIETVSLMVASVIANHRYEEELSLKTTEFLSLVEIGKVISSVLNVEELLNLTVHTAMQLVRSDSVVLMFYDEKDKKFEVKASLGAPDGQLRPLYGKLNQELMKRITSNNSQPLFVADTSKDEYFKNLRRGGKRVKSLILVPIKRKNKLIGVLSVDKINSNSQFVSEDADLLAILAGQVAVSIENATLYEQLHDLFLNTIQALAQTIEAKDKYTRGHSERVTKYAVKVARALSLPEEIIEAIRHACILHDIGKIAVEEAILKKTASLRAKERSLVERHPKISAEILKPIAFLKDIIPIVYHHHERYDGSGYLDSLKGNEIPVGARILAVVDAYEAMTSDRSYRRCMPKVEAIAELKKGAGKQFDPEIVKVFLSVLEAETRR